MTPATLCRLVLVPTLVFLAGCLNETPVAPTTPSGTSEPASAGPMAVTLAYTNCGELDFAFEAPVDAFTAPKMRPKTIDPAGRLTQIVINTMACEQLQDGNRTIAKPTAFFGMIPVEPVPEAKIAGISSYLWLIGVFTADASVADAWKTRGVDVTNASVSLTFSDFGMNRKAQSKLLIRADGGELSAEATMAGSSARGAAGRLGIYTTNDTMPVRAHAVDFTDYTYYSRGAALLRPGSWFGIVPGSVPEPRLAYENLDYGVTFRLDQVVLTR